MGAGFLQDLVNKGATQNATQAPQYTMPTYQGGGYTTTQGDNFNYTTPNAPYAGTYTAPMNINPTNTAKTTPSTKSNPFNKGGQVYYDPEKGQYYTQDNSLVSVMFGGNTNGRSYMGSSPTESSGSGSSFDNPSALPNYAMYIPPSQMPDINAYLQNPNSLLGALQSAGVPSAGAGRFSNLLSTNTKGK